MDDEKAAAVESHLRAERLRTALEERGDGPVRLLQTHISWVLLTRTVAIKLKKPVRLPFLDFTTLAARARYSREELRLNRRLAPSLYLDVVDVCEGPSGLRLGGDGRVVDVALRMRRFPDGALWSERLAAGQLQAVDVDALAQRLAGFHRRAAVASIDDGYGAPALQQRVTDGLTAAVDRLQDEPGAAGLPIDWPRLRTWLQAEAHALVPHWEARRRGGRVRECHGDLHLANIVQLDDGPTAFDGIEFDADLRWIDPVEDIAFLVMDLVAHGAPVLAHRFLDGWLQATGDHEGLPALRFYLVRRALVRGQVAALRRDQGPAEPSTCGVADYLVVADKLSRAADARLAITHGLPGSGKSFVSQRLIEATGAVRVRSDVERKRLFGLGALESSTARIAGGIYDPSTTQRTYDRLLESARLGLEAGWPVIIDAAFLRRAERVPFEALAAAIQVPFSIIDCVAPLPALHRRIAERQSAGADASEADGAVLERLAAIAEPLEPAEAARSIVVDAGVALDLGAVARQWLDARA
jgi:aminoglycoside phosphotransferase family enzyme/predicted kinase